MFLTIVVFIIILSVLVLVHEFGHFIVAKRLKIKVEEFGFGLPPRIFGIKRGETLYSINWLPIGGFVKLYGEDDAGSGKVSKVKKPEEYTDRNRAFFARPAWQRAFVSVAGVLMNFILAVAIISYLFSAVGVPTVGDKVIVSNVTKDSPAAVAGIKKDDTVLSINNQKIKSSNELISITKKHLGEKVVLEVKRDSEVKKIEVTPRKNYPSNQGPMGVSVSQEVKVVKYPWYMAPFLGTKEALYSSWLIISGLATVLYQLIFFGVAPQGVAGPVGIAELTGQFVQVGPYAVLSFVSLLSLNLAILNILPFPALDGGRLFFIVLEVVFRRKVNQKFESYAHAVGMAILLALIALITIHDVIRLFTGQPLLPQIQ
jgi:regulator of sigma E protease